MASPSRFLLILPLLTSSGVDAITYADLQTRKANDKHYVKDVWIFLGSVLAFFTVVNWVRRLYHLFVSTRKPRARLSAGREPSTLEKAQPVVVASSDTPSCVGAIGASISTAFRIVVFRWSLCIGPYSLGTVGELAFVSAYISANLIWLFINTRNLETNFYKARAGMIATAQLPLVVALANKNSVVSFLTGLSHEKLNVLHRASGRTVFVFLWIHVIGRAITDLPPHVTFSMPHMIAGFTGIAALTAGTFLSLRIFRQAIFEFFFMGHLVLMSIFIITAFFHVYPLGYGYYVWPSFVLWGLDRILRVTGLLWNNYWRCSASSKAQGTIELLTPDTIRLTMKRQFTWRPGQHAYVCIPKISKWALEFHPFTISTIPYNLDGTTPAERDVVFLIRARDGLTRRLKNHISEHGSGTITAYVDGPYGFPPSLHQFSTSILIAGGSGISYTLPQLLDLIRLSSTGGSSAVHRLLFVWIVRGDGNLPWINKIISEALASVKKPLIVEARIYITGAGISPGNKPGIFPNVQPEKDEIVYIEPESDSSNAKIYHGRPDVQTLLDEEISIANGPVSVDIAGPAGLTTSVRAALTSGKASAGAALKGRRPVTLHVETFDMVTP
ncbi:hypothetical protein FA15DRAFT_582632 [Coprinopsis marcescibilis]|uniref:ferric-chelate reductase (NADPH) n=1 Tax=Coprinopsis marcescibilis TaxID=230819 RepID=A0A5C3LA24_COPMA|nr:hypothetical protein FA15DRAFT_582632 [Coprinopsis marcescibilis]